MFNKLNHSGIVGAQGTKPLPV